MITADGEQDGGFELVENQQPPSGDHSDEQNEEQDVPAGTAVLEVDEEEDDHRCGALPQPFWTPRGILPDAAIHLAMGAFQMITAEALTRKW